MYAFFNFTYFRNVSANILFIAHFQRPSPDIKPCLYEVLYDILLNNWRYFFKASALESIKSQNPPEEIEHQDELISIIQV